MKQLFANKWTWIVGILIILNIASLSTIWVMKCSKRKYLHRTEKHGKHHQKSKEEMRGAHIGGKNLLTKELNLTEAQQKEFDELRAVHFREIGSAYKDMQALKSELIQNLGKPEAEVESVLSRIGNNEALIQKLNYAHFNKMYELCNEEQKKILKEKLLWITTKKELGAKMRGRHGKPHSEKHKKDQEIPEP